MYAQETAREIASAAFSRRSLSFAEGLPFLRLQFPIHVQIPDVVSAGEPATSDIESDASLDLSTFERRGARGGSAWAGARGREPGAGAWTGAG